MGSNVEQILCYCSEVDVSIICTSLEYFFNDYSFYDLRLHTKICTFYASQWKNLLVNFLITST